MKAPKEQATMTELLRQALLECQSLRAVERETGVIRQTMALFMSGKQSLRLDKADTLAAYFGIRSHRTMQKGR
jgi:plasmid maintenance system antidote protein VapI